MTLTAGDVLYLPRGVVHEAFCSDRESLHLTVSIVPLTYTDLIEKALRAVSKTNVDFRQRVPWSSEQSEEDFRNLSRQVKQRILKLADQLDLPALIEAEHHSLQKESPKSSSSELEAAIASLLPGVTPDGR
jgi:ribosomal protein L16 Arg81 hydroxylase